MKKDDLFALALILATALYVGGHVVAALLRPVLNAGAMAMPR